MPGKDVRFNAKYIKNVANNRKDDKIQGEEIGNSTILSKHIADGTIIPSNISKDWPAFYAQSSGRNKTTVANVSLIFDGGTRYNIGNHYNESTYRFEVPFDGLYFFWLNYYNNSTTKAERLSLVIDGSRITMPYILTDNAIRSDTASFGAIPLYVTAGQFIDIRPQYGGGTYYGGHTAWGGYLIR